ncbi:MAG: hemerythrin domain-containing protein [Burkholderiales bacterium]
MSEPSPITWSDIYLLGYGPMDDTHREFVELVRPMQTCPDDAFIDHLRAFRAHAVSHFGQEWQWMEETDFPSRDCHHDEHNAVLNSVEDVLALLEAEPSAHNLGVGRSLAAELVRWFPGHADYLDSALSHWMCKRTLGGKPIVIRRNISDSPAPPQEKV